MTGTGFYAEELKRYGLSVTRMRLAIMEALHKSGSAATPAQLLRHLRKEHGVHKTTVHRNVAALEKAGLLRRVSSGSRAFHYELTCAHRPPVHPHFTCHACQKVVCLEPVDLSSVWGMLAQRTDLRLERAEITLVGLCPSCGGKAGGA